MRIQQRRCAGVALTVIVAVLAGTGCGSSSNTDSAHIRAVNFSANAGNAAVTVNGGAIGGNLTFGQTADYNFIGQGSSTFAFTTDAKLLPLLVFPASPTLTLKTGSFYTGYLLGRSDVAGKADPRFLQTVVTGARGAAANYSAAVPYSAPPSGSANVRILNAAPDAPSIDVLVNGKLAYAAVAYPPYPTVAADTTVSSVNPVTAYAAVPTSSLSVQVNTAGTAQVLVPATSVSVAAGSAYTLVITEPTVTPAPTFGLQAVSD